MKTIFSKLLLFFCEGDGTPSSQRLVYIVGSFFAMFMGAWSFHASHEVTGSISVVVTLSATFGLQKLYQKGQETKPSPLISSEPLASIRQEDTSGNKD